MLDNRAIIKQLDPQKFLNHILDVPEQIRTGYALGVRAQVPALYAQARQIVFVAIGECLPVAKSLESLLSFSSRVPCVTVSDSYLPSWVSSETLVIVIDYSGSSEQAVLAVREAADRRARIFVVSLANELDVEARRVRAPYLTLDYGAPARIAYYHMLACVVAVLKRLGYLELTENMIDEAAVLARSLIDNINPEVAAYQNNAKQLADKIFTKRAFLVSSGLLVSMAAKWQIAFATTGKYVAVASELSTFNDTIINGIAIGAKAGDLPLIMMLQSKYDDARNKLQQTLAYQVAQSKKIAYEQIFMHPSGSMFGELVLASVLGDMVSYYLAMLGSKDPTTLEASKYISENLARYPLDT